MDFILQLPIFQLAAENPLAFFLWVIEKGWVFLVIGFVFFGIPYGWLRYLRGKFDAKREFTLLALDIPRNTEQSPKAVESIFTHLSGVPSSPTFFDKWFRGVMPPSFSCEIVSMGGYIQLLIQTPTEFRDLVEAAVYAQYPDAEISEVEDYAEKARGLKFPHPQYEIWGTEFDLAKKQYYPIKTYPYFEHSLSQELKDPLSAILEAMSKITPDEQIWLQLVITPASDTWKSDGEVFVKRLVGEDVKAKKTFLDTVLDLPIYLLRALGDINLLLGTSSSSDKGDKKEFNKMNYLTPGQRGIVEKIEMKMSKIGFYSKFRMIYIARKEAFNPARGIHSLVGAIKQLNTLDANAFKKNAKRTPNAQIFFPDMRNNKKKNRILRLYRTRARLLEPGYYGNVLNTEELATIFHFPTREMKTPFLRKIESKKAEPPVSLPIDTEPDMPNLPIEEEGRIS